MGKRSRKPNFGFTPAIGSDLAKTDDIGKSPSGTENRKSDDSGNVVDLAKLNTGTGGESDDGGSGAAAGSETGREKRKYTRRSKESVDLTEFIAENLFSAHAFLAGLSGKDILRIEQSEADELGKAVQNVARHYDIPGVDQKTVDWIRLARTLGMVYGTRLFAARAMRAPHTPAPKPAPATPPSPAPAGPQPIKDAANPPQPGPRLVRASPGPGLPDVEIWQQ